MKIYAIFNQDFWWEKNYDAEVRRGNKLFQGVDRLEFIKACEIHQARWFENEILFRMGWHERKNTCTERIAKWKQFTSGECVLDFEWAAMSAEQRDENDQIFYVCKPEHCEYSATKNGPAFKIEDVYCINRVHWGRWGHRDFDRDNYNEIDDPVLVKLLTKRYNRLKNESINKR